MNNYSSATRVCEREVLEQPAVDQRVVARATAARDYAGARRLFDLGIGMTQVTDELLGAGFVRFGHSYDETVAVIRDELRQVRR